MFSDQTCACFGVVGGSGSNLRMHRKKREDEHAIRSRRVRGWNWSTVNWKTSHLRGPIISSSLLVPGVLTHTELSYVGQVVIYTRTSNRIVYQYANSHSIPPPGLRWRGLLAECTTSGHVSEHFQQRSPRMKEWEKNTPKMEVPISFSI